MAFPALIRRLFSNDGAGPMLRPEIVPQQNITVHHLCEFYYFRHPTLKPGFQAAQGGVIANAPTAYPKAWAYLQTVEGQKLCVTEAQWQAMVNAVWHTNADGSKVGWNGIGGAPCYVVNTGNGTLRLPDLRGMYAEAAGFDSLGAGGVHGDAGPDLVACVGYYGNFDGVYMKTKPHPFAANLWDGANTSWSTVVQAEKSPVASVVERSGPGLVKPRAWGSLACVCLDPSAS